MANINWILEKRKIKDLIPHLKNPRLFTKKGMKDLEKSIKNIGMAQPVNITKNGVILSGHARILKLKEMGVDEVDVYVPNVDLTEKQQEEIIVRMNANTAGEWDFEKLANEFELPELTDWGLEIPQIENFKLEETVDDDEVPDEPLKPITVRGDLYELGGKHRILCGDSTMIDDVEKLMGGGIADMVFTDPPYNTGMSAKTNSGSARLNHMFDDDFSDEDWDKLLVAIGTHYFAFTKDDSVSYICLDWRRSHELVVKVKEAGFKFSNLIVWDKMVHGLGSDYKYTHEFIHVFKKGKPELKTNQGEQDYQDIWHIQRKIGKDEDHATKKPIELCDRAIRHASKKGDVVLDLFLGSGSTLIACEKTKRVCYGMELSETYCDVVIKRYIQFCEANNIKPSVKRNGEDCLNEFKA